MKRIRNLTNILYWVGYVLFFIPLIVTSITFAFNKNSLTGSSSTLDFTYKYETNEVSSWDDVVIGNLYKIDKDLLASVDTSIYTSGDNYVVKGYTLLLLDGEIYVANLSNSGTSLFYRVSNGLWYLQLNILTVRSDEDNWTNCELYIIPSYYSTATTVFLTESDYNEIASATITTTGYDITSVTDTILSPYNTGVVKDGLDDLGSSVLFGWTTDVADYVCPQTNSFTNILNEFIAWCLIYNEIWLFLGVFVWFMTMPSKLLNKYERSIDL